MSQSDKQADIVIVGAGMIGASMALRLSGQGWRMVLLDGQALPNSPQATGTDYDPRVSALTHASQRLFDELGVWQAMCEQRVSPYTHMHVREADGTGRIDFTAAEIHAANLGHIVENRVTASALHTALQACPDIELRAPVRVEGYKFIPHENRCRLTLSDGSCLVATLVIAADGARSPLRTLAGIQTRSWDYGHRAIVTTAKTAQPHKQTARQIFMDDGVLAFLPLSGGDQRYCSIVWSAVPELADTLLAMEDDNFATRLTQASEHWLGAVESVSPRQHFPLQQCHAADYFRDNLVLIGDAAHSIHPLAGQGANLGLQDAVALAEELQRARHSHRNPADPLVLARYQRRRKPYNLMMMTVMEGFRRLYADQPLPLRWLRNTGMRTVNHWPLIKNHIMREALG